MPYCRKCGKEISGDAMFCPSCGQICNDVSVGHQQPTSPSPTIVYVQTPPQQSVYVHRIEKSKGVALLLCFFLGGLGIHQFYLGNTIQGVFYLIFSWTCIPALISIIDFIILLCMSEAYFHQKYDRDR